MNTPISQVPPARITGVCRPAAVDEHAGHRRQGREQQPTGPHQGRRAGDQPGGHRQQHAEKGDSPHLCAAPSGPCRQMGTVPFFRSHFPRRRPEAELQEHQRAKRRVAENHGAGGDRLGIEGGQGGRQQCRPRAEQLPRQPPHAGNRQRAQQGVFQAGGQDGVPARQPEHRRQNRRIARGTENLRLLGAILVGAAFGDRPAEGEIAVAVAHAEVVRVARLPIDPRDQADPERQSQHQNKLLACSPTHARVTAPIVKR